MFFDLVGDAWAIPLTCAGNEGSLHTIIPCALTYTILRSSVSPEQDLIDSVSIRFYLALNFLWGCPLPSRSLLSKERLKLDCRRSTRLIEQFKACDTTISIEDDELAFLGRHKREFVDLATVDYVLSEIAHVLLAFFK